MAPTARIHDIIKLIKEDHKPLKAGIKILIGERTDTEKQKALHAFLYDLELHAKTEEKSLYDQIVDDEAIRDDILEGYEEHALADLLSSQLKESNFAEVWSDEIAAKAKVLAELVKHHIDEEEEEMLPNLRDAYDREALAALGEKYLEFKKEVKAILDEEENPQPAPKTKKDLHVLVSLNP